jgi:light-regulated signal transduction histidine kinase (bacteriophytochrome)
MVYRFEHDQSGVVIAEARADGLEPFLGLRYPASDIPVQVRELFKLNRCRVIGDRDAEPSPVLSLSNLRPLDLSYSMLRGVSPVHIEYLTNMGVRASASF